MIAADELEALVDVLRGGGVVACATETQMGLLADALSEAAVAKVCLLKNRPDGVPLAVLIPSPRSVSAVAREFPEAASSLADRYWPGPLTVLVRVRAGLPAALSKDGKIGVRIPGPSPARELVRAFGSPLTATSANLSGQAVARDGEHARVVFGAELDAAVAGTAPGGLPSTVVDTTVHPPQLVRRGAVRIDGGGSDR